MMSSAPRPQGMIRNGRSESFSGPNFDEGSCSNEIDQGRICRGSGMEFFEIRGGDRILGGERFLRGLRSPEVPRASFRRRFHR